ncbi:MAG TPA: CtsR family transcriptional regulator [Clostridiales bacterium]|nr:CtsR family transcriptional regulator [Clostridiales bacterium]
MRLSDIITEMILKLIDESDQNVAEIQRNELAAMIGCVPSQINYVLTSRFTPEHGFKVESRRGGGGYIRITKITMDRSNALMHIINSVGSSIDSASARVLIENIQERELVCEEAAEVMKAALSNNSFKDIPVNVRDQVRAAMLKQMLVSQL